MADVAMGFVGLPAQDGSKFARDVKMGAAPLGAIPRQWLMQARDTVTGDSYLWVMPFAADSGEGYIGPNAPNLATLTSRGLF